MGTLIDTSILIYLERSTAADWAAFPEDDYFISVVTVSELLVGTHRGLPARREARQLFADAVFTRFAVLGIDHAIAALQAKLTADMFALGRPPGIHDLWIAATAIYHGLTLMTRDTHSFPFIPGVRLLTMP